MATYTTGFTEALKSWQAFNKYLADNKKVLTTKQLEVMLRYEMKNKKRMNFLVRLNNKIFEINRKENLKKILRECDK